MDKGILIRASLAMLAYLAFGLTGCRTSNTAGSAAMGSGGGPVTVTLFPSTYLLMNGEKANLSWFLYQVMTGPQPKGLLNFGCSQNGGVNSCSMRGDNDTLSCDFDRPDVKNTANEARCEFYSFNWPSVPKDIANAFGAQAVKLGLVTGSSFKIDGRGSLACNKTGAAWACNFPPYKGHMVQSESGGEWDLPRPSTATKIPVDTEDEFGNLLPASSAEAETWLPSGYKNLNKFRISDAKLNDFIRNTSGMDQRLKAEGNCRAGEIMALSYYAAEGYKRINGALRILAMQDEVETKKVSQADELAILATASAMNCMPKSSKDIVVRGANLSAAKLAKYKKGKFIIENAFTSTTLGKELSQDFSKSSTEFRIIMAKGVLLNGISAEDEENELLIMTGTLFKVLDNRKEGDKTIIEMQQLP